MRPVAYSFGLRRNYRYAIRDAGWCTYVITRVPLSNNGPNDTKVSLLLQHLRTRNVDLKKVEKYGR